MALDKKIIIELDQLLLQLNQQTLDDQQKQRLAEIFKQHPEAIEDYLDQQEMDAMLRETFGLLNLPSSSIPQKETNASSQRSLTWALAIALTLLIASLGSWMTLGHLLNDPELPNNNFANSPTQQTETLENFPVATISHTLGAELKKSSGNSVQVDIGSKLFTGHYHLDQGVLRIVYKSGASVLLQSPITFQLVSANKMMIAEGCATVKCPTPESKGFKIDTPTSLAVDLGTEFSVDVDPKRKGEDEFHVFSGKVRVNTKASHSPVSLKQGQASRLDHKTMTPAGIDMDYQRFIRDLSAGSSDYQNHILNLQPVVYYNMNSKTDGKTLINEAGDYSPATVYSIDKDHLWWGPGFDGGTSLHLKGISTSTYAVVEDYPKTTNDTLAVTAWVYAESRVRWASIAKNWEHGVEHNRRGQFHFGLYFDTGHLEAHINDHENAEQSVIDRVPLPLNQWHHVAFVADGTHLRLYRNGVQVDSKPYFGLNGDPRIKPLAIGTKFGDDTTEPARPFANFWDGYLDHIAVFNKPLTAEEVKSLYEAGHKSMLQFRDQANQQ